MTINWQTILTDAAQEQGFRVRKYSGRNMYGKTCLAIVGDGGCGTYAVIGSITQALPDQFDEDELSDALEQFGQLLKGTKEDSMGRDVVVYWPSVEFTGADPGDDEE